MKRIIVATTLALFTTALTGCSMAADALSFEAGKTYGSALSQTQLDTLAGGDAEGFCRSHATVAQETAGIEGFSVEQFTQGCVAGITAAE